MPPQEPGEKALEGTLAHEFAEIAVKDFLLHKLKGTDPDIRFELLTAGANPEIVKAAQGYRNIIWKQVLHESITKKAFGLEETFIIDEQLSMWGIVDFWTVYVDDRMRLCGSICDFKYGYHEVDIDNNPQLAFYAVALRKFFRSKGKDLDYVNTYIYQPRTSEENAEKAKESYYTSKQLDTWEKRFLKAAHTIFIDQKPKFKVGDWCRWCECNVKCPAYGKDLQARTSLKLVDPEMDLKFPAPEQVPDDVLSKLVIYQDEIKNFLDNVKSYAISRHINGRKLPGLKLVESPTRRKWRDDLPETEIGEELKKLGVPEPFNLKLKGITEVERYVGKGQLENLCGRTEAKKTLVPSTDKREEIPSAIDKLDDIEI